MTTSNKIAIFPASGALGTSVYTHLSKLVPAEQLILISRNPTKLPQSLLKAGVEARKADYNTPSTFAGIFNGATYLFLISYPSIEINHRFHAHQAAVNAALKSGVRHVFYTSLAFGGNGNSTSHAHVMQAHLKTEAWLAQLAKTTPGFSYTVIREGIYAETFPMYTAFTFKKPVGESVTVKIPHDGKAPGVAWVKIDELGEASAKLVKEYLDQPGSERYRNRVVVLSGPKAWTLSETVAVLGKLAGKEVAIEEVSEHEHAKNPRVVEELSSHGPGDAAADWTTVFKAIQAGETAVVNGELERLLGRKAEDFEESARKMMLAG